VLLRLNDLSGRAFLAAKDAVNDAITALARAQDFPELQERSTTNSTTSGTYRYHLVDDFTLTRFKDLQSIVLSDGVLSRKLQWLHYHQFDEQWPDPTALSSGRPHSYTTRGNYVEFFPVPDSSYSLVITYTIWPQALVADSDTMVFSDDLKDVVTVLATEIAKGILSPDPVGYVDWSKRAKEILLSAIREEITRPDVFRVAKPFNPCGSTYQGEYWKDPCIKGVR